MESFGPVIDPESLVRISFGEPTKTDEYYEAEVIGFDGFGNVFLYMPASMLEEDAGTNLFVETKQRRVVARVSRTFGEVNVGELLILKETSHGFMEIAVNMGSAREVLGIKPGDRVRILRRSCQPKYS